MSNPTPTLRPELPADMPPGIARLRTHRGYPVPWFVADIDGEPDFRVIKPNGIVDAVRQGRCWICGATMLAGRVAYVAGPMCGVNRNSAEPPSHILCADWAARACPFLTRPHMKRREGGMPEDGSIAPGAIMRNPGVALVWITSEVRTRKASSPLAPHAGAMYFDLGIPLEVRWYCEGREATRAEVEESVATGLPSLMGACYSESDRAALRRCVERFIPLMPDA